MPEEQMCLSCRVSLAAVERTHLLCHVSVESLRVLEALKAVPLLARE